MRGQVRNNRIAACFEIRVQKLGKLLSFSEEPFPLYVRVFFPDIRPKSVNILLPVFFPVSKAQGFQNVNGHGRDIIFSCVLDVCRVTNPCKNGATCQPNGDGQTCQCTPSFQGEHCDKGKPRPTSRDRAATLVLVYTVKTVPGKNLVSLFVICCLKSCINQQSNFID